MTLLTVLFERVEKEQDFATATTPPGSPVVQRRRRFPDSPGRWTCFSAEMDPSDAALVEAVYDETRGGAGIFQWEPPRVGVPIDCRFVGELDIRADGPVSYQVRCTIEALRPQE